MNIASLLGVLDFRSIRITLKQFIRHAIKEGPNSRYKRSNSNNQRCGVLLITASCFLVTRGPLSDAPVIDKFNIVVYV